MRAFNTRETIALEDMREKCNKKGWFYARTLKDTDEGKIHVSENYGFAEFVNRSDIVII